MSKSSELDKVAKRYIIDCIDWTGYDVPEPKTDAEKVQFLHDTFYNEYGWAVPHMGETNALREWFAGLPSSCTVAFTNYGIEELGRAWGSIAPDAKDSRVDFIVSNWFNFVANKTAQLFRKHCQ